VSSAEAPFTHVCYLDARVALDSVRMSGLLHDKGITGKDLRIIKTTLRNASNRVVLDGCLSEPFAIEQGTRQGSICASFFYTAFVDGLLKQLQASPHGLKIGDVSIAASTQADDIVLLSLTSEHLSRLCKSLATHIQPV